jgi:hypothetical protein
MGDEHKDVIAPFLVLSFTLIIRSLLHTKPTTLVMTMTVYIVCAREVCGHCVPLAVLFAGSCIHCLRSFPDAHAHTLSCTHRQT